jgi:hypothetical protein
MASWLERVWIVLSSAGWVELFVLWVVKATLVLVVAWSVALLLRRASAASRHLVWTLAVLSVLALPVAMLLLPAWGVPVVPVPAGAGSVTVESKSMEPTTVQSRSVGRASSSDRGPAGRASGDPLIADGSLGHVDQAGVVSVIRGAGPGAEPSGPTPPAV